MVLNYRKSESTIKPDLVDTTSSKTSVYLRQNIIETEVTIEGSDATYTKYEYEEAKLTKSEYQEYLKELETTNTLEIVENLKAENKQLSETVDMLTNCILEMSEVIYN